jgi:membrane protein implicated in regulation of membrane protease activity
MYWWIWVIAFAVFVFVEAITYQLVSIWLAGGALGGLIALLCGGSVYVQLTAFVVVAALLLILTRPFVKKLMKTRHTDTNVDALPGKTAVVTEEIDNRESRGRAKVGGIEWRAESKEGSIIAKGETVVVDSISGVRLIVKKGVN